MIKLTSAAGKAIWVNHRRILTAAKGRGGSLLHLNDATDLRVQEHPRVVARKVRKADR